MIDNFWIIKQQADSPDENPMRNQEIELLNKEYEIKALQLNQQKLFLFGLGWD